LFALLEARTPLGLELDREGFLLFFDERCEALLAPAIGGAGGGVALLSVAEARARSFDAVFVAGMSRDVFPRAIGEDPLLPDELRRALRGALPDLPVKREGYDEERFVFAQLLSSSPEVALSYPSVDDEGRRCPASPLLERVRARSCEDLPGFWQPAARGAAAALRPAFEHAQLAGLVGSREQFARALRIAIAERVESEPLEPEPQPCARPSRGADALAAARIAVLDELDPRDRRRFALGPYFGFAGAVTDPADPRRAPLYVTQLERIAQCAWQSFLLDLLRVEPAPDALAELPALDAQLVGRCAHEVLQQIVSDAMPGADRALAEVAAREPVAIAWPAEDCLRALLDERARALLREQAIALRGFERALADRARACVERARELGWPDGAQGGGALGAEVEGIARVRDRCGSEREIHFRADRVDRSGDGLALVDYKTGAALADQKSAEKRSSRLRERIADGSALQAAAYAIGGSQLRGGLAARGRYLYLGVDTPTHARVAEVESDDRDCSDAFARAVQTALDAWDGGSFTPRLVEPSGVREPRICRRCPVKEACLRGDSGARQRIERWVAAARAEPGAARCASESAAIGLWDLGVKRT
ncbi:MAG TPA: PD-(D/E)XK nuclease family protein, partial [Myxococcota bacterium]|nr:PD-(D/E)XK nuclease family protein [Myxococcota bacterium]